MESYLLQSGISLACFYIVYYLLVRHHQKFNLNRIFILLAILISGIIPFLDFQLFGIDQYQITSTMKPIVISSIDNQNIFNSTKTSTSIFSIVYIIGLLIFFIRSVTGIATLFYYYWRFPRKNYHGFTAVVLTGNQSPFTFFNLLFINQSDFEKTNIDEMIVHENVHRMHYHGIDLILMEVLSIVHWFNPFIWLIKKDLKSEHEFLADEQVIKKGFNIVRYQSLLLKSHEGLALYMTNSFNYSILKKRFIMMKKQKSNRKLNWNYTIALPTFLVVAMILFFNFQSGGQINATPDILPEYKTGNSAFYKVLQKSIKYPKEARKNNVQGTVYISFTINKNGKIEDIKAEDVKYNLFEEIVVVGYGQENVQGEISNELSILQREGERVIALIGEFNPGIENDKPVRTRMTIPITFKLR